MKTCAICNRPFEDTDATVELVIRRRPKDSSPPKPFYLCAPSVAETNSGLGSPCVAAFRANNENEHTVVLPYQLQEQFEGKLENYFESVKKTQSLDELHSLITVWTARAYSSVLQGNRVEALTNAKEAQMWLSEFIEAIGDENRLNKSPKPFVFRSSGESK